MRRCYLWLLFGLFLLLFFPRPVSAQGDSCWCTGPDANGNVCKTNGPACGNSAEYGGFNICCSNPNLYNSHFALKSPVCGSSTEIIPTCAGATFKDGGYINFCFGNEFRLGATDPAFSGIDNEVIDFDTSFQYNGQTFGPGSYYVCNTSASCCANTNITSCNDPINANVGTAPPSSLPVPNVELCADMLPGEPDDCIYDGNLTRPDGTCKSRVPYVHSQLEDYTLTCAVTPKVDLSRKACGEPPPTTTFNNQEYINLRALVNFSQIQLGGFGPDLSTWQSGNLDGLARVYPYNALADKPLVSRNTQREDYRSFWRLLSLHRQLTAKAEFFARFKRQDPPIFDSEFAYLKPGTEITKEDTSPAITGNPPLPANTGTNIGYGHYSDFFASVAEGKPVTILISIGASLQELQEYRSRYANASLRIVRVTDLTPSTPSDIITRFARNLSTAFAGDYTVFGNELNSQDEYPCGADLVACGTTYASQFFTFKANLSGLQAAAAPMNTSNAERDAALFLQGARTAYQAADVTAHNVYSGTACAYDPIRCDTSSWQWEQSQVGVSKPYLFTEYNLTPPDKDTDLKQVLEFITSGPSGPIAITPLIRNVCSSANGDWLLYDGRILYDATANVVEPGSCLTAEPGFFFIPSTYRISTLIDKLPPCLKRHPLPSKCGLFGWFGDKPEDVYALLDNDTKAMYDAFLPFDFDNVRGYLGLRYVDPVTRQEHAGVLAENLPYIQAVKDILGNAVSGILSAISPNWLNQLRNRNIFTSDSYNVTYPQKGRLDYTPEANTNFGYVAGKARDVWSQDMACTIYDEDAPSLASPQTYPYKIPTTGSLAPLPGTEYPDVLDQFLLVPSQTNTYDGSLAANRQTCNYSTGDTCGISAQGFCPTLYITKAREENSRDSNLPVRSKYGRTITVLTNPKMTDVSRLISEPIGSKNYSLLSQLLPSFVTSGFTSYEDTPMLGQAASYGSADPSGDPYLVHSASGGDTGGSTAPVERKGGQAEIDLCILRNFWLRPGSLQVGQPDDCKDLKSYVSAQFTPQPLPGGFETPGICPAPVKQHLFKNSCPGGACYNYIFEQLLSRPNCNGQYLNPYLVVAIALNEDGGLTSGQADASNIKHFGCDPFGAAGVGTTIPAKLSCTVNTFTNYQCRDNLSLEEALNRYGYSDDARGGLLNVLKYLGAPDTLQIWVSQAEAAAAAGKLRSLLPAQTDLWANYYRGFLEDFTCN